MEVKFLNTNLGDHTVNLALQLVCKENTRFDFALAEACGACFLYVDVHGRPHSLSGDLHQSEFAQWQYVVACTVFLHVFAHSLIQQLPVLRKVHIDEIHNDYSTHIPEP